MSGLGRAEVGGRKCAPRGRSELRGRGGLVAGLSGAPRVSNASCERVGEERAHLERPTRRAKDGRDLAGVMGPAWLYSAALAAWQKQARVASEWWEGGRALHQFADLDENRLSSLLFPALRLHALTRTMKRSSLGPPSCSPDLSAMSTHISRNSSRPSAPLARPPA